MGQALRAVAGVTLIGIRDGVTPGHTPMKRLAARTTDQPAALIRTRLKRMQYRPGLLDGFTAETGLALTL